MEGTVLLRCDGKSRVTFYLWDLDMLPDMPCFYREINFQESIRLYYRMAFKEYMLHHTYNIIFMTLFAIVSSSRSSHVVDSLIDAFMNRASE